MSYYDVTNVTDDKYGKNVLCFSLILSLAHIVLCAVCVGSYWGPMKFVKIFCNLHGCVFKRFGGTHVLFVGSLMPLFWTSGDICPGFQNQAESLACMLSHL